AHTIKNANAHQSRAVCNLKAFRGPAVTGTPIQSGSFDLYSLMAFLRFEPFSIKSYWQSLIQHPLGQGNKNRLSRLQVLMATTLLRRTKEKSLIGLPPKNVRYMITWKEKPKLYDDVSLCPPELRSLNTLTSIEDVTDKSELLQKLVAILQDGEDLRF
uniref:SNF2 N-terminal domain-containing protein n=2 Tax=Brassica TaxID=3705 RepID=A0A0D3CRX0_BRAOL